MKQTHLHSWKWRPNIELMHSNNRQELSTIKAPSALLYNFVRPRIYSPIKSQTLVPPHCDSMVFSMLSFPFPSPLLHVKYWCIYTSMLCFSFQTKLPMLFRLTSNGDGLGEGIGSGKMPPFSISGMLIQLFIFQEVTLLSF